ncbi:MAG: hypothetical protein PUK86_08005 [bacterium]|nr:hypothetical protein [bacterium]
MMWKSFAPIGDKFENNNSRNSAVNQESCGNSGQKKGENVSAEFGFDFCRDLTPKQKTLPYYKSRRIWNGFWGICPKRNPVDGLLKFCAAIAISRWKRYNRAQATNHSGGFSI